MLKLPFLVAFLACAITGIIAEKKIVCYYGSWAAYRPGVGQFEVSDINPALCTHMIYTFIGIDTNGAIRILDGWLDLPNGKDGYRKFIDLAHSRNAKALIAIGGWNEGSSKYSQVVSNAGTRARFVQNVVQFLKQYNFDGFDVDWEYPNQRGGQASDKENYISLLRELKQEFKKYGYILSVATAAAETSASKSYIISQMSQYVDFINLMTYDLNGSWDKFARINAPLYASSSESGDQAKLNVNSAVKYWLSQGAPADKLVLGIPTYGRSFTLANSANNWVGAPTVGPGTAGPYTREGGMLGYNEICENLRKGWTVKREPQQRVPYAFKDNQWVGYDDVTSVQEKVRYIKSNGLGGAMVWSVETDDFRGFCGERYPLLSAINRELNNYVPPDVPTPKPPHTTTKRPNPPPPTTKPPGPSQPGTECKKEGYMRDPNNCSVFYYCHDVGGRYEKSTFNCGAGLAFNPSFNGCDYKENVPGC